MRDGNSKRSKASWPKTMVKRWFNIKSKGENCHADGIIYGEKLNKRKSDQRSEIDLDTSQIMDIQNYRFQEIVPLNAGNVLGSEDNGPAKKWLGLIKKTLSSYPESTGGYLTPSPVPYPIVELDDNFVRLHRENAYSFSSRRSFQSLNHSLRMHDDEISKPYASFDRRFSVCDRVINDNRPSDYFCPNNKWDCYSEEENGQSEEYSTMSYSGSISMDRDRQAEQSRYCLVASKQMVGIFLTVWIKSDLRNDVRNLKVSCVGRGLMGYLRNKGSISISMSLHHTSFCFVCSHLSSGEKDGDEQRRNSDVMEILRKTRFPRVHDMGDENSPQTILEHEQANSKILASLDLLIVVQSEPPFLLSFWKQLRTEQRHGRVFTGWKEGRIYFPPTYKYSTNSDRYAGENTRPKEKRRTPAW
ncbi:hypothetical protein F511_21705 [Dorcoceras hygrometricum]|uniref:Inositol polyphosphate-related phosphatase domain-containing protein n=1 Tax=Dorcoceras hygrometricum TaxID=472368 RepID=A0A2Z7AHF7_9LAMI|nr:hypothetical protein F511_21705 [Dorcoceras hygrometricum]